LARKKPPGAKKKQASTAKNKPASRTPKLIQKPVYVAAFDDSGGIEPLIGEFGRFKKGDHPIAAVAYFLLRKDLQEDFDTSWNALRSTIQQRLGCKQLPPIHLRLMYGRTLPDEYRGGWNPYARPDKKPIADFAETCKWLSDAIEIIERFGRYKHAVHWQAYAIQRTEAAASLIRYFNAPASRAEMMFIRQHSEGLYKNMYKRYHQKLTSVLLPRFVDLLGYLNEDMNITKASAELSIDRFKDSSGVDTKGILSTTNSVCQLQNIISMTRVSDADDTPICQAADLLAFLVFRTAMGKHSYIKADEAASTLMRQLNWASRLHNRNTEKYLALRNPSWSVYTHTVHYALARQEIEQSHPTFADEYLVTPSGFLQRVLKGQFLLDTDGKPAGTSVFRDPSVISRSEVLISD
jgi:hypothetical protein